MRKIAVFLAVFLTACTGLPPTTQARIDNARPPAQCHDARECEYMFATARRWVADNCQMRIQTQTDSYLETWASDGANWACRVSKDPLLQGGYEFRSHVSTSNPFYGDPRPQAERLNAAIWAAGDAWRASNPPRQ